ncbi:transcriptional regulator, MarR family [Gluconacetobacter diazotrophicus PA1 5]|uniref:MarR family transcriptional regulator n=1 Tax=Gluconacetobacter diazotrophicus TaxID=33996 RepID=A0A7W4I905_GLUDI|nr:MarR family transcriptional regulator [Gluconacetobacter diazotrophicus]ACI51442.1 transcriptional regulator, MarR family [Gluconacetobacter diazotrophicus PA1 5]MBB2158434.1 MarR family transcriptional regulator [Gluconacetobacter diazotrophicus]TWA98078.1 MarR family transcriptional regulator [Gluconacetobacter diazotrophicus]
MPGAPTLEHFLCFALYSTSHAFNRVYKPLLDAIGLTYPQYLVMTVLWEQDGLLVGQIGEKLALESSTLTPLIKRLEAGGLLQRTRDTKDERQVRVTLTSQGRALEAQAASIPACILEATGRTPEQLMRLKSEIDALRNQLEQAALGSRLDTSHVITRMGRD